MTTISAEIVLDSISPAGIRLTTMLLEYPRWIHAEFMTHRVFSRNAASSRAIPVRRMIEHVEQRPAVPLFWTSEQKGMQGGDALGPEEVERARGAWMRGLDDALRHARALEMTGCHKQVVNRILEPFMHIRVLVSATDWANFFALRCHPDAEPHIQLLASKMRAALEVSSPTMVWVGEWHLPYLLDEERSALSEADQLLLSGARCASLSYQTVDGKQMTLDRAKQLEDKLKGAPVHASPFEHLATPDEPEIPWRRPHLHGNFTGWCQYRKMIPGEAVRG